MGKGKAKLGKEEKGANNADEFKPKPKVLLDDALLKEDIKMLEQYEALATVGEQQRLRLQALQLQEEQASTINKATLRNIHRKMLREEKAYHLRREIDIMAQNHERDIGRKDVIVQMLIKDLDDAEEQSQVAQRAHMVQLQELIDIHSAKCHTLHAEFEAELKAMKSTFVAERGMIVDKHAADTAESRAVMKAVERQEYDKRLEDKRLHRAEREDIRGRNLEGINELRIDLEQKIIDLEKQFDEAHLEYTEATRDKNNEYKELMRSDEEMKNEIDSNKREIERLEATLEHWRKKMELNRKEFAQRNQSIKDQKDIMTKHCAEIKQAMTRFREGEQKRLVELTTLSRAAKKSNEQLLEQAERILQLAQLNRRMLTEREKVLPPSETSPTTATAIAGDTLHAGVTIGAGATEADCGAIVYDATQPAPLKKGSTGADHWDQLENFYKIYNKVLLDKFAIAQEQQRMQEENEQLKVALKQYLDGIAVAEDAVGGENPLLVVNGRTGRDMPVRRKMGQPTTVIDGAAEMRTAVRVGSRS